MSNLEPDETAITVNVYVINYWLIQTVAVHQSWCRDNFISILLLILVLLLVCYSGWWGMVITLKWPLGFNPVKPLPRKYTEAENMWSVRLPTVLQGESISKGRVSFCQCQATVNVPCLSISLYRAIQQTGTYEAVPLVSFPLVHVYFRYLSPDSSGRPYLQHMCVVDRRQELLGRNHSPWPAQMTSLEFVCFCSNKIKNTYYTVNMCSYRCVLSYVIGYKALWNFEVKCPI